MIIVMETKTVYGDLSKGIIFFELENGRHFADIPDGTDTSEYIFSQDEINAGYAHIRYILGDESISTPALIDGEIVDAPEPWHSFDGEEWVWDSQEHKKSRCLEVDSLLSDKCGVMFDYEVDGVSYQWQVDQNSQIEIFEQDAYAIKSVADPTGYPWDGLQSGWINYANESIVFDTPQDFQDFSKAVFLHCKLLKIASRTIKNALLALDTFGAVRGYDIDSGWPE